MPPIIHPIWLLLLLCGFLLLVVGCSMLPSRTPTRLVPTSPPVTLTVYRTVSFTPVETSYPIEPDVTSQPPRTPSRQSSSSSPIYAEAPTCYDRPDGGYTCLGRVWNESARPIEQVQVEVQMMAPDDVVVASQVTSLEQQHIPAGEFAPYRVLFAARNAPPMTPRATVLSSQTMRRDPIPVSITAGTPVRDSIGNYQLQASVTHTAETPQTIQTILTVLDDHQRVVGYRVQTVPGAVPPQQPREIRLQVNPQVMSKALTHTLHAEVR